MFVGEAKQFRWDVYITQQHSASFFVFSLLLVHHVLQASPDLRWLERREAELGAPGLQRRNDLVHVVTDHAEPCVLGELLDDCSSSSSSMKNSEITAQHKNGEIRTGTKRAKATTPRRNRKHEP